MHGGLRWVLARVEWVSKVGSGMMIGSGEVGSGLDLVRVKFGIQVFIYHAQLGGFEVGLVLCGEMRLGQVAENGKFYR